MDGAGVRVLALRNVVQVRFGPGAICAFGFLLVPALLREVFSRVLRFSPFLKNQHFQILIRSWNARAEVEAPLVTIT